MLLIRLARNNMGNSFLMVSESVLNCRGDELDFQVRIVCFDGALDDFVDAVTVVEIRIHVADKTGVDDILRCVEVVRLDIDVVVT